jgi:hypothetical protein
MAVGELRWLIRRMCECLAKPAKPVRLYPFAGRASYILASLYLRRNYGSIFRSAQSLQLRTARRLVKDLTRSISAALTGEGIGV